MLKRSSFENAKTIKNVDTVKTRRNVENVKRSNMSRIFQH